MTWFKLDDAFGNHPKVRRAGNAAVGLWVRCATYSAQYELDGKVPAELAEHYGSTEEIDALIETRLWVMNGAGFIIPDFLEFNPSAEEAKEIRAKRADAGRKGGLASGQARSKPPSKHSSKGEANA